MSLDWQIIESGILSAQAVMAKDADLLEQLDTEGPCILHLYDWDAPCFTYGYFTNPANHLHVDLLQELGIAQARRPTGGGIIFHLSDLAFSILIPASHLRFTVNTLENYAFVNGIVQEAIAHFTAQRILPNLLNVERECLGKEVHPFCMAKPTQYDIMMNHKKLGGAAQRRTKKGLLHQASVSLFPPPKDLLKKILINEESVLQAMDEHSHYLISDQPSLSNLVGSRLQLTAFLKNHIVK